MRPTLGRTGAAPLPRRAALRSLRRVSPIFAGYGCLDEGGAGPIDGTSDGGRRPSGQQGRTEIVVPCDARWLSTVRGFVGTSLQVWGWSREQVEVPVLLAGEVAGNAVRHVARGTLRIVATPTEDGARVSVHDAQTARGLPLPVPRPKDGDADGGRGLQVLDTLADRWGTESGPDGKTVWFEISR